MARKGVAYVAVAFLVLAAVPAKAAILTFDQGQILSFQLQSDWAVPYNIGTTFLPFEEGYAGLPASANGAYFEILGLNFTVGANASTLGIAGASGFDQFDLTVRNWNDQTWGFSIFANLSTGYFETPAVYLASQPDFALKPGGSYGFTLAFDPSYVIGESDLFGVHVRKSEFDIAHFEVVPEPGTLFLFGAGLIGLVVQRKLHTRKQ